MQIEFSNADTTVQLPQSLDSVSLQAPGPLRIEDDGAGVLPAATTLDTGTGLSATDQGDGIVRLDAAASGSGVDVTDSGAAVQTDVSGIDFGTGLDVTADGDGTITVDAAGGVDVPGSDTQVIFNDAGSLGASSGLTYDGTLTVQGDGTLVDLKDSNGDSGLSHDITNNTLSLRVPGTTNGIDFTADNKSEIIAQSPQLYLGKDGDKVVVLQGRSPASLAPIGSTTLGNSTSPWFTIALGNGIVDSDGHPRISYQDGDSVTLSAKSGQTDPILQLNDETGSAVFALGPTGTIRPDGSTSSVSGTLDLSDGRTATVINGIITDIS